LEKNLNEINASIREVEFKLTKDEIQPHFDKAYKKAQPHIDMKGFRKGKVPLNIIKKYYGKQIEIEALEDISNEIFRDYLNNEEISIIGTPKLIDLNTEDGGYSFKISYEVLPGFDLADYRGIIIDEPVHSVTDEEIDNEIEMLCRNNGNLEDTDQVTDDLHIVDIVLQELDESTSVTIVGQKAQETRIFLADQYVLPEMKTNLLNTKLEDNFVFKPHQFDSNAPEKTYRVTVKKIQKLIPAEFTNDFVEKYSQGKFKTTEELREEIGFRLQEKWDEKTRKELENQLITKIVDMNEVDAPKSVVDNVIEAMAEDIKKRYANTPNADKLTNDGMADGLRPLAERTVKWEIIRNRIIKEEQIEVEDYDIEEIVNAEVARTKGDANAIRNQLKQNKNISDNILTKKVLDLIIDFAVTEEISFEEYDKKQHDQKDDNINLKDNVEDFKEQNQELEQNHDTEKKEDDDN
jgi:trigger factor